MCRPVVLKVGQGTLSSVCRLFLLLQLQGAPGIRWVEANDDTHYTTVHSKASTTKHYPTPRVHSANFEKPVCRLKKKYFIHDSVSKSMYSHR